MAGYILLHRSLLDNWIWEDRIFSKAEAWIDLIFLVNFAEGTHIIKNEIRTVPRGSKYITIRDLGKRWKWSRTKVVNFLELLKKDKMITLQNKDKEKTMLTIVNWDFYQLRDSEEKTRERQEKDTEKTLNKEGNKGKEGKENIYTPEFESWYKSWPRPSAKKDSFKNFEKRRKEHGLEFILMCSKNYLDYFSSLPQKDQGYPYQSNNFFGEKAYYLDFTKAKNKERDAMREIFGDNVILG